MAAVTIIEKGAERSGRGLERLLEEGNILFFPESPIRLTPEERSYLLAQKQNRSGYHKNIAYRPASDRLTGFAGTRTDQLALKEILRNFSKSASGAAEKLLPDYASAWKLDYASFRPEEEAGRELGVHSQNDLLHVDAFPSRPTSGDRILRVFTNINPSEPRVWLTGPGFGELAAKYAERSGLLRRAGHRSLGARFRTLGHAVGLPLRIRSPYDEFMLGFHHFLKENREFQASAQKTTTSFPPGSAWIVFTDMVSHAVLSGRFALEQTFIVARASLAIPERAPAAIFETLCAGRRGPEDQSSPPGARP